MDEGQVGKTIIRAGAAILILVAIVCGVLVLALGALYVHDKKPWKVKDPSNPKFDVSKFDPNDYKNHEELAVILRQLLTPSVSTKTDMDMLWCKQTPCGRAISTMPNFKSSEFDWCANQLKSSTSHDRIYWYSKPGKTAIFGAWTMYAFVDDQQRLINLCGRKAVVF